MSNLKASSITQNDSAVLVNNMQSPTQSIEKLPSNNPDLPPAMFPPSYWTQSITPHHPYRLASSKGSCRDFDGRADALLLLLMSLYMKAWVSADRVASSPKTWIKVQVEITLNYHHTWHSCDIISHQNKAPVQLSWNLCEQDWIWLETTLPSVLC